MPRPQPNRSQNKAASREAAMSSTAARSLRRKQIVAIVLAAAMVLGTGGAILAVAFGGNTDQLGAPTTTTTQPGQDPAAAPALLIYPAVGETLDGDVACPAEDGSSPRVTTLASPPPVCIATLEDGSIDTSIDYRATMRTDASDIVFFLSTSRAPETVNNFVVLARYGFFDGAPFDVAYPQGWAEAGGRFADGTTGPGYTITGEAPDGGAIMSPGTLAMAPTPEGSSEGGRLLLALGENAAGLPLETTAFGLWLEPQEGLQALQRAATDSGRPTQAIVIEGITIEAVSSSDED